ncbi:hypothetical protein P3H15_31775 [Rhodococcus sp. T2V]|nr:hypothetical protein [Rhodococcus sp. T2V]
MVDPKADPEYLTLSAAGKECGVSVRVLRELIQDRHLVAGVARTRAGHAYLHRDHVPSWSEVEALLVQMYQRQLARLEKAMRVLESEVEAVRFDLNEAKADPNEPLGDDLLAAADYAYGQSGKTLSGAVSKLNSEVMALAVVRAHLDEVRRTV